MQIAGPRSRIALRRILLATDFSPCSERALHYALSVARRYDSMLYVAHVILPDPFQPMMMGTTMAPLSQAVRHAEQEMAQLLISGMLRGVPHQVLLGQGAMWETLSKMIHENDVDLVVVGTHGRTGVRKVVLGSVAEEIFRLAPCPVLSVGPKVPAEAPHEIQLRHILYASDFSAASDHAAAYALSLAQEFQARITLLHAVGDGERLSPREMEAVRRSVVARMNALVPAEAKLWCEPEFVVSFGPAAEAILGGAKQPPADLIVLGVKKTASFPGHLPPGTAYKVVCEAHCPVFTVRAEALPA